MTTWQCAAANPAGASRLQSLRPVRRVAELGSLGGIVRLVLPIIIGVLLTGCTGEPDCDVMSEKNTPSPDGRYVATVFEVTCHDTTGYTPHAHLRRAGQKRG